MEQVILENLEYADPNEDVNEVINFLAMMESLMDYLVTNDF